MQCFEYYARFLCYTCSFFLLTSWSLSSSVRPEIKAWKHEEDGWKLHTQPNPQDDGKSGEGEHNDVELQNESENEEVVAVVLSLAGWAEVWDLFFLFFAPVSSLRRQNLKRYVYEESLVIVYCPFYLYKADGIDARQVCFVVKQTRNYLRWSSHWQVGQR